MNIFSALLVNMYIIILKIRNNTNLTVQNMKNIHFIIDNILDKGYTGKKFK